MWRSQRDESQYSPELKWAWDYIVPSYYVEMYPEDERAAERLASYVKPLFDKIRDMENRLSGMPGWYGGT